MLKLSGEVGLELIFVLTVSTSGVSEVVSSESGSGVVEAGSETVERVSFLFKAVPFAEDVLPPLLLVSPC